MFARVLVISFGVVMLASLAAAQEPRRGGITPFQMPAGLVYVSQRIDLTKQIGADEMVMTIDGEPPPRMEARNVTLGVILDDAGHVVTRLAAVTPDNPAQEVTVTTQNGQLYPAKFIGMDTVTGLCVLKVEALSFKAPAFIESTATPQRGLRLFGFHPLQGQSQRSAVRLLRPRIYPFPAVITKAQNDFRYSAHNPIYYLTKPQLTPVQDGSLVVDSDNAVFGIAVYDTTGEGNHLVYPVTRVRTLAQAMIQSNSSIAHGWLGATGSDVYAAIPTRGITPPADSGVRVTAVIPDSPAEKAGVKQQDVLLGISGRSINSVGQLTTALKQLPGDSEVTLKVKRGNEYKLLQARLTPAPAVGSEQQIKVLMDRLASMEGRLKTLPQNDPQRLELEPKVTTMRGIMNAILGPARPEDRFRVLYGFEVQPLTEQLATHFGAPGGVMVTAVTEGGKAARTGLEAGDVIVKVGDQAVTDFTSVLQALEKGEAEAVELSIVRQRGQLKLTFHR